MSITSDAISYNQLTIKKLEHKKREYNKIMPKKGGVGGGFKNMWFGEEKCKI